MFIVEYLKLEIKNYRNLKNNTFDFGSKINYFYGENALGKTNLLESIWMFTGARSFRKTKDTDLIKFGEEFAKLEVRIPADAPDQYPKISYELLGPVNEETGRRTASA